MDAHSHQSTHTVFCLPCFLIFIPWLASSHDASAVIKYFSFYPPAMPIKARRQKISLACCMGNGRFCQRSLAYCFDLIVSVVLVNSVQRIQLRHPKHSVEDTQNLSQRKVKHSQEVRVDRGHHCTDHNLGRLLTMCKVSRTVRFPHLDWPLKEGALASPCLLSES